MRISDWSSDVCSSDLRAPDCARHRCGSERSRPNWSKASDVRNITGEGIVANVGGEDIRIVSPGHLARTSEEISDPRLKKLESQGKTDVVLVRGAAQRPLFALADIVRPAR